MKTVPPSLTDEVTFLVESTKIISNLSLEILVNATKPPLISSSSQPLLLLGTIPSSGK
jgi:hypothetical protein